MSEIESSLVKWNLVLALCWPSKENSRSSAKVFHCKLRCQDGKSRCGLSSSKIKSLFYFDKYYFVCLHWVLTVWCLASQVFFATKSKLYVKSLNTFDTVINKTDIFYSETALSSSFWLPSVWIFLHSKEMTLSLLAAEMEKVQTRTKQSQNERRLSLLYVHVTLLQQNENNKRRS